jgi:hypothetical protein
MATRRSTAPVQADPIRARLGKPAPARDVVCANCGVTHSTSRRWQMRCPECHHGWTDRSSRTLVDEVRDRLNTILTLLVFGVGLLLTVALFGGFVAWVFLEAADTYGWARTSGLLAFFIACFLSLFVLGRLFKH